MWFSKCGVWTSSVSITWELVSNADYQGLSITPELYRTRNSGEQTQWSVILTSPSGDSDAIWTTVLNLSLFTISPFWWLKLYCIHSHGWNQLIASHKATSMTSGFSDLCTHPHRVHSCLSYESYRVLGKEHLKVPLSKTNQALSVRRTEGKVRSESVPLLDSIDSVANSICSSVAHVASVSSFANGNKTI